MPFQAQDNGDAERADAALERLAALHPKLIDLGLDRTFALLAKLGNPQDRLPPTVHVAGTNGKGSVIAMMRAMAEAAGLRVHVYASPHLCRFNERIRLAGQLIDDAALAALLEEVESVNRDDPVTFFEVTTAAAMLAFARQEADLLLLETGLGGALDSTNVLTSPRATVITPIAHDHEHFLGSDIAGIAGQKAGIMRSGICCFSAKQAPAAAAALQDHAADCGAELIMAGRDFDWEMISTGGMQLRIGNAKQSLPQPSLFGAHQRENAALAATVMLSCFPDLPADNLLSGIGHAVWPGRIQHLADGELARLAGDRALWLDGAHNAHGAAALAAALPSLGAGRWNLICGALNTRNPVEFLAPLAGCASSVTCIAIPGQDASLSATELCGAANAIGLAAKPADSLIDAITRAASMDNHDPIIICGSLYLAGHVLSQNKTPPA